MGSQIPTSIVLDWLPGFQLGLGIEAPSVQLLGMAVKSFAVQERPERKEWTDLKVIDSEEKLAHAVEVGASASFNNFTVEASFATNWRKEVSCSHRTMTILLQKEIAWPEALVGVPEVTLRAEAEQRLRDGTASFRAAYGDYFIAGYVKKARFYAVYRCETSSEEALTAFKAEGDFAYEMLSVAGNTQLMERAKKHGVNISCRVVTEGTTGGGTAALPVQPAQIEAEYKHFCEHVVGLPSQAVLYHYCLVNPHIGNSLDVNPDNLVAAQALYRKLLTADTRTTDIPRNYRRHLMSTLDTIRDKAHAHIPPDLRCETSVLRELALETDAWLDAYEETYAYYKLWRDLKRAGAGVASGDNSKDGERYWPSGYIGQRQPATVGATTDGSTRVALAPYYEVAATLIHQEEYGRQYKIGHLDWSPSFVNPQYRICGYEVTAHRNQNGQWARKSGGLRENHLAFHFYSEYDRGMHWSIRIWGVPATKVMFDEEEFDTVQP
jgi:hypothetical protein